MNHLIIKYSLLIGMIVMLCRCSNSTFQIDADFPGGNVIVVDIERRLWNQDVNMARIAKMARSHQPGLINYYINQKTKV